MKLKRWLLIAALLAVIVAPAMGQSIKVEAEPESKALVHFIDKTTIRVSAGPQLLVEPFRPAGINPFENILVQGEVDPSVRYYIAPKAKVVGGTGNKKNALTRLKTFRVEYLPIENVGGPPVLLDPIVWEGVVDYNHLDQDGNPTICDPSGHPLARTVVAGVVGYYILRETTQGVICLRINLSAGLPVCWNSPFFKSDGSGKVFDPEDFDAAMEKLANPKAFRGWLEIIPNSHDLAWVRWQITYEAKAKNSNMAWETKPQSGIFVFDFDGDGYRNDYEIEMGTDPYDPNDYPGRPQYVSVPNVVGKTTSEATNILTNVGLVLDPLILHTYSNTVPAGKIISQAPVPTSQVLLGTAVNVTVSDGPQPTETRTTPNVVSKTISEATTVLLGVQLQLGAVSYAYSDTCPVGKIISQAPVSGTVVPINSAVAVTVSLGPEYVSVPSVVGKTTTEADTILTAANLVLGTISHAYSATVPAGKIISQAPVATSQVLPGTAVNVVVSDGPQPVNPLVVNITSPADNFVGTVGQHIPFMSAVTGGATPYDNFKWHLADNSFRYTQNIDKVFDFPGAGWNYIDVTDHAGTVAQDKVWVQINAPVSKSAYRGPIFWMGEVYQFGSWPAEAKAFLGL